MENRDRARREVMASKNAGNRGSIPVGEIGQLMQNSKQKKLITQERNGNTNIIVKVKDNEDRDELEKFKKDLSRQVNKEMEVLRKELKVYKEYVRIKDRLWEGTIKEMEERIEELEEKVGELEGWEERLESSEKSIDICVMSEEENDSSVNDENRSEYNEIGQLMQNSKQKKLITQERDSNKKIIVKVKDNEDRDELKKFKKDLSQQVNKEMDVLRKELKVYKEYVRIKDRLWEERIKEMEKRIEELEEKVGELEGWEERLESSEKSIDICAMSEEEKDSSVNDENRSEYNESRSNYSRRMNDHARSISQCSEDRLSNWEVNKSKKLLVDVEEREMRKCNIVIKGILFPKDIEKNIISRTQWIQEFIKEKLEVECKVISSRSSGPVIIARIGSIEQKNEIMQNKYKLKGHNIFIEHDISWEEREIQRKILRWAIEQRNKGEDVIVGIGKVKVGGVWKLWAKIEEEEDKKNKEEEVEVNKGKGKEQNFY